MKGWLLPRYRDLHMLCKLNARYNDLFNVATKRQHGNGPSARQWRKRHANQMRIHHAARDLLPLSTSVQG
jgi:hypothetical protein